VGEFETTVNGLIEAKMSEDNLETGIFHVKKKGKVTGAKMSEDNLETGIFHVKKKGKVTGSCEVLNASIHMESSSQRGKLDLPKEYDPPLEISLPGTPEFLQLKKIFSHPP
jgi:hypothetical protein